MAGQADRRDLAAAVQAGKSLASSPNAPDERWRSMPPVTAASGLRLAAAGEVAANRTVRAALEDLTPGAAASPSPPRGSPNAPTTRR